MIDISKYKMHLARTKAVLEFLAATNPQDRGIEWKMAWKIFSRAEVVLSTAIEKFYKNKER